MNLSWRTSDVARQEGRGSRVQSHWLHAARVAVLVGLLAAPLPCLPARGAELRAGDAVVQAQEILKASGVRGGLVVHVGCGDPSTGSRFRGAGGQTAAGQAGQAGALTAALRSGDNCVVHGLDRDPETVRKAREFIASLGAYGPVSVDHWDGKTLPYPANMANLIVVSDPAGLNPEEAQRILVPGGVACTWEGGSWKTTVKPVSEEYDDWSHYMHDADGNPVSKDTAVGFPRHLQWVGSPRWGRNHDHLSSISGCVSAGGRVFYIIDQGSRYSVVVPAHFELVARDAYNGVILWKRSISEWQNHLWDNKSGPAYLPRRLVASKEKVYVTLGFGAPVTALDAATGKDVRTYEGTEGTSEIIHSGDMLILVAGRDVEKSRFEYMWKLSSKTVLAVNESTGATVWKKDLKGVARMTLACDGDNAYIYDEGCVTALARSDGAVRWRSEVLEKKGGFPTTFTPTLVAHEGVVLIMDGSQHITAFQAGDGAKLWDAERPLAAGFKAPDEMFVIGGVAWWRQPKKRDLNVHFVGRDLHTGALVKEFLPDFGSRGGLPSAATSGGHHRCHPARATVRQMMTSIVNIEFIDRETGRGVAFPWVRGACLYGIMPANGMIYAPQHPCQCIMPAKMNGFVAMSSASVFGKGMSAPDDAARLETSRSGGADPATGRPETGEWPAYRHDPARGGTAGCAVAVALKEAWKASPGGRLTPPTIAGGKVFVASVEAHTLHAYDVESGKPSWKYIAGGPVDSPPTIVNGRCIFGCADGWVYCLSASDGTLLWRFRAAPMDRRMMAWERLESVWPLHGSVLVLNDAVYCVAGRAAYFDGGLRFLKLDAKTGAKISERVHDLSDPASRDRLRLNLGTLPDILSSDGKHIFMRDAAYDLDWKPATPAPDHFYSAPGMLDDEYFHRSVWRLGGGWQMRTGSDPGTSGRLPMGRILSFDKESLFGFGRKVYIVDRPTPIEHDLFRLDRGAGADLGGRKGAGVLPCRWERKLPFHVRAMVATGETLFVAGPPDVLDETEVFAGLYGKARAKFELPAEASAQDAAILGDKGAVLWAVSADKGEKISEYSLDALPVFDGMAAAYGKLYVCMRDGTVRCMAGTPGSAPP